MFHPKFMLTFLLVNCFLFNNLVKCSDDDDNQGSDEDSKEIELFMRLMIKSSQKSLKRLLERIDIGSISSPQCNSSWNQFMADNQLTPERFSCKF